MLNNNFNNNNSDNKLEYEEIEREIAKCLQDIDPKYYNPNFNIIGEIVNIMGDINFDKVKLDIERLNKVDEKLDRVIKLIVDKHSDEFFRILGFVRQIQKEIDNGKLNFADAKEILSNITNIISNLSQGENSEWKLRSIYISEIIGKLNKTQMIFKIIQDCEVYMENNKVIDAILLLKKSTKDHLTYDKEFRSYNLLVSINLRFKKIEEMIEDKLYWNLVNLIFFPTDILLDKKINSLINYFLTCYGKMSIDNELAKPLQKYLFIIKNVVNNNLINFNFDLDGGSLDNYFNEDVVDLDSEKKLNSLVYLIKCLRYYDKTGAIAKRLADNISNNITEMLEKIIKMTTDYLKMVDYNKYDLDSKTDKIKLLLFFQIYLVTVFHSISKIIAIDKFTKNKEVTESCQKMLETVEKNIFLPLVVYNKLTGFRQNTTSGENEIDENVEFAPGENLIRMKINEILVINVDNLPILYKIYFKFTESIEKIYSIKFANIFTQLSGFNKTLYKYYAKKIVPKKFFDIGMFISDYDSDSSNFKFINEFIKKINKLKELLTFCFDNGYLELVKILKDLFTRYFEETKLFIDQIKLKCTYNQLFSNIYEEFIKIKDCKEVSLKLEFKKYEKNLIDVRDYKEENKFNDLLMELIEHAMKSQTENIIFISRNYKLLELLTKFIYLSKNLISMGENFLLDLMKQDFSSAKMLAILEQTNTMHFVDVSKDAADISTSIMLAFKNFEKMSNEMSKLVLICKLEYLGLIINLTKNIRKHEYWLNEPQMTPEYFIINFINEFNIYNQLYLYNLNESEYAFISKDFLYLINNCFINSLHDLTSNTINGFGVNLLIRDFEYIREKVGQDLNDRDPEFTKSIFYFPNYIKFLNMTEEQIPEELKRYYKIKPYEEEFVAPLLDIRTDSRHTLNQKEKSNIINSIYK
jgi:hypothetical protein